MRQRYQRAAGWPQHGLLWEVREKDASGTTRLSFGCRCGGSGRSDWQKNEISKFYVLCLVVLLLTYFRTHIQYVVHLFSSCKEYHNIFSTPLITILKCIVTSDKSLVQKTIKRPNFEAISDPYCFLKTGRLITFRDLPILRVSSTSAIYLVPSPCESTWSARIR